MRGMTGGGWRDGDLGQDEDICLRMEVCEGIRI